MTPRTRKAKKPEATKSTPPVVFPKFAKEFTDEEWKPFWADICEAAEKAESLDAAELAEFQTAQKHRSNHLANKRADPANRPRTRSARPIGNLPLALERGGLDAALWPWIKRFTDSVAPILTRRVLPMLRRRISKMTPEDYFAVTRNPSPDGKMFSRRSHDKRAKLRAGLASLPKFQNKF